MGRGGGGEDMTFEKQLLCKTNQNFVIRKINNRKIEDRTYELAPRLGVSAKQRKITRSWHQTKKPKEPPFIKMISLDRSTTLSLYRNSNPVSY